MKAAVNTLASLADIGQVTNTGQIRRITAQMLLALARKEISAGDIDAASKMLAAQSAHMAAEVKVATAKIMLRDKGGDLGKLAEMGKMLIGDGE